LGVNAAPFPCRCAGRCRPATAAMRGRTFWNQLGWSFHQYFMVISSVRPAAASPFNGRGGPPASPDDSHFGRQHGAEPTHRHRVLHDHHSDIDQELPGHPETGGPSAAVEAASMRRRPSGPTTLLSTSAIYSAGVSVKSYRSIGRALRCASQRTLVALPVGRFARSQIGYFLSTSTRVNASGSST
jgi:hypothetical protein